jgi:hypothetical protein
VRGARHVRRIEPQLRNALAILSAFGLGFSTGWLIAGWLATWTAGIPTRPTETAAAAITAVASTTGIVAFRYRTDPRRASQP